MAFTRPKAAQIDFDLTNITDTLIRINSSESGDNANDLGIIFERGNHTNAAIVWDESADAFRLISTTHDASTTTSDINISAHHNLHVGALETTGNVTVGGNLTVTGTTTTVDVASINITNSFSFEGATPDGFETTLTVADPTADRTITLPDVTGYAAILQSDPGTTLITATVAELNYVDGVTSNIQTQIDNISSSFTLAADSGTNDTFTTGETLTIAGGTGIDTTVTNNQISIAVDNTIAPLASPTFTGTLTYSTLNDGTTSLTSTVAELNIIDGDTSATSTTLVDADRFVVNDGGTMVQVAASDVATYIGAASNVFKTISVAGQSDVVADSNTDTLTLAAGDGLTITTNAGTDTITFTASSSDSVFSANSDFASVADSVVTSEDLDLVTASTTDTYDLGTIAVQGIVVTTSIVDGNVTTAKIADDAITSVKLSGLTNASSGIIQADGDGTFSISAGGGISNVVDDTTPQLGGDLASNGNDVLFADNDKAIFGAGSDLQIYHDGSNSYVQDTGTGDIIIKGDNVRLQDSAGGNLLVADTNDAVQLYYGYSLKLATTATGVDVTGSVTADGMNLSSPTNIGGSAGTMSNAALRIGTTAASSMYFDTNEIHSAETLNFFSNGTDNSVADYIRFSTGGSAGSEAMRITSAGNVGIGVTPGTRFDVGDASSNTVARIRNLSGGGTNTNATLQLSTSNNYVNLLLNELNNYTQFQHAGNLVNHYSDVDNHHFRTKGGVAKMTIDSSGNVGIGTSSPSHILHTSGTGQTAKFESSNNAYQIELNYNNSTSRAFVGSFSNGLVFAPSSASEAMRIDSSGNVLPGANGTQDLGSASLRWQNIYTSDLNLNNGVGNYTVVEGEEDLFLYNNKSGKVFKFALIEVDPSEATPKIEDLKNGD